MKAFLELVAEDIFTRFNGNLQDLCLVFPNRRSILYFNRYLSEKVDKPVWAPRCISISEFIQGFSSLKKADDLTLLFELHQVYCKVRQSTEAFDQFYFWGELMLSDFDDLDKYQVDAQNIFQNLSALKNINEQFSYLDDSQREAVKTFWGSFIESRQSNHHKAFSDIWSCMFEIYCNFRERLAKSGIAYEGLIYRDVAQAFQSLASPEIEAKKVAFIGFNALNECEKSIFKHFQTSGKGLFYWDFEQEYTENTVHEAGFFIRQNLTNFPQVANFSLLQSQAQNVSVELYAVPSNVGQAKVVSSILNDHDVDFAKPEKTAILLTDESLLMPVLHALPKELADINITMGYPVKNAALSSLIENIGNLYLNLKETNNGSIVFYYKHVVEILNHPYILKSNTSRINSLVFNILKSNRISIESSTLQINPLLSLIFSKVENGSDFLSRLAEIVRQMALQSEIETSNAENPVGIESEAFATVYTAVNKLIGVLNQTQANLDVALTFRILKKIIAGLSIPFEGEPLRGIQVMGFLESRALDFENLIILGVNEGNLPKVQMLASFIPYNLRRGFGLPTLEFRDAMYAYYFYRIINRAQKVTLVYNTSADSMGGSEVSRYVTQMMYSGKYNISQKVQSFSIVPQVFPAISISKDNRILEKLLRYTENGDTDKYLSPSALTNYIECPLRFYFRYTEGLKEFEQPTEEIDPSVFGSVLHHAIQSIYSNFNGKLVTAEMLNNLLKDKQFIENEILKSIDSEFLHTGLGEKTIPEGRNYLIFRILTKYIHRIIRYDISRTPFTILGLENKVNISIPFTYKGEMHNILIGGIIDRVDRADNVVRIIDYKTGSPETAAPSISNLFVSEEKKNYKEIFQTLLYCFTYKQNLKPEDSISPCLYSIRQMNKDQYSPTISINKANTDNALMYEAEYMSMLQKLVEEIFNPENPFTQTENAKNCTFCAFKPICHK